MIDGVSVTLSSGAATTTSGGGYFSFLDVEGGTYTITITGLPADASFDATTAEVTIAQADQTVTTNFSGSWIRTASLMGMVTVEGEGLPGITVSISGRQEAQMVTDDNGQYTFTGLRAGNYTVEISGFDATDVGFAATSSAVEVAVGESKVWSFDGTYVRESVIAGQVSVEGSGLAGVTVSLQGMGADDDQNTDMGGQFTFSDLRAGEYQLAISGYDTDEYGFSTTSATVRVEHGRTANVPFEGILLRTAAIMGQVSIEGEGLADVTVSLSGEGESHTTMTDNSGQYAFSDLPAGNFQVGISGYDTDDYSFETTSKNVALALGETATVPFEGILLRTSGISGRVSVEGMGLDSVMVTLSGDDLEDDMTSMTDATGQYAIAGLAEGDYTVAISGYDDVAYIFTMTSMDVTLGDDDTQIVNFMGTHARTASVTGMVYVDEAGKNDAYDEGEHALAAAGIVLALVGPGILDQTPGATGPDGSFAFTGLRAGPYQLVVANSMAAGPDHAYGGPAEGYAINLAVGQAATRNIPFDITHTTVNFMVNLKSGENMGAALPGATVTFFSDMAGEQKIGDAETGDDGMASMRIARSMASNHTVYASVAAPEGSYHTSGMRQAVMWDAQMTTHMASNHADIVNRMADFSFSGATIDRGDYGGGKALGGWAISVSSDKSAAEDTPDALGADGAGAYSEVVDADSLPVTYTVALADDQGNALDGGSKYTAESLEHTHDGLSLAATMDAGMIEVTYTTQTLKVYVHHEMDQVHGYTGNVLGGDARMSGLIDVNIRYIAENGRSRAFPSSARVGKSDRNGVVTFSNVPADHDVIVIADEIAADDRHEDLQDMNIRLLRPDELAAYTDMAGNGIMGGAFGDMGGSHHTVELCPLMATDPTGQRHGECGSFAFVSTYLVNGQVWKHAFYPARSGDGWTEHNLLHVAGTRVSLGPVEGENLGGDSESFTAASRDNTRTSIDERKEFNWGQKAAGVYEVTVPDGWVANVGAPRNAVALGNSLNPLAGDLQLDVTPSTGFVYGRVTDDDGFAVEGVSVHVNGVTVTTDGFGRYYAEGFPSQTRRISGTWYSNKIFVETNHEAHDFTRQIINFVPNSPTLNDFGIAGSTKTATIAGTITAAGTGEPVAGARIWVDYGAGAVNPLNAHRTRGLLTDDDGSYSATVRAQPAGTTVAMSATKSDRSFTPAKIDVSAIEGSSISGISFTGFLKATISGRVTSGGRPMEGATVVAEQVGGTATDTATTGVTGTYSLFVPYGNYDVKALKDGYDFSDTQRVNVGPGESKSIDDFTATETPRVPGSDATLSALSLSDGTLVPAFAADVDTYTASVDNNVASVTVTGTATDANASVAITLAGDTAGTDQSNGRAVELGVGETAITAMVVSEDESDTTSYTVTVTRAQAVVTLSAPASIDEGGTAEITASVDHGQAEEFTVTVSATGGTIPADANTLTFAAGATDASGSVTVTAANDTIRNATAQTVTVSGSTDAAGVAAIDDVEVAVTDDEMVASAPRNLEVAATDGTVGGVTLTWDRPIQIGTWPITGYEAEATAPARASVTGTIADPTVLSAAFTGLTLGVEYTFTVHATTAGGDGDQASTTGKALPTVSLAVGTVGGGTTATIIEKGTDTEPDSVYVVASLNQASAEDVVVTVTSRDDGRATPDGDAVIRITAGATTSSDSVLVKAVDNPRDSTAAATVVVAPVAPNANAGDSITVTINDDDDLSEAPRNLTVTAGDTKLTLEWISPANSGTSPVMHYQYRHSTDTLDNDDEWITVTGGAAARSVEITGLTNGTAVNVEVRAVTAAGNGAAASETGTPASGE